MFAWIDSDLSQEALSQRSQSQHVVPNQPMLCCNLLPVPSKSLQEPSSPWWYPFQPPAHRSDCLANRVYSRVARIQPHLVYLLFSTQGIYKAYDANISICPYTNIAMHTPVGTVLECTTGTKCCGIIYLLLGITEAGHFLQGKQILTHRSHSQILSKKSPALSN